MKPIVYLAAGMLVLLLAGVVWSAKMFIGNLRAHESAARYDASHDQLSGLLNRAGLQSRLSSTLKSNGDRTVLHLLDLDGFKFVNDTWGHPFGDDLLRAVSSRLAAEFPEALAISRLGGDEFVIVGDVHLGRKLVETVKLPFHIDGRHIRVGASIGVVENASDGLDVAEAIRRADIALYQAKARGKNRYVDFETSFDQKEADSKALAADLRGAIERCDIDVMYQPIVCASSLRIIGVEALARWKHPSRGSIPPDRFIPGAEHGGMIDELGRIVMCKALSAMAEFKNLSLSVNVSPVQLNSPTFVEDIVFLTEHLGFDPARLVMEVTEGVFISQPELANVTLERLRQLSIRTALDDFGCGYASIGALKDFRFDKIKLDRSLTTGQSEQDVAFLQATISLAVALRLPVTAEGIEDPTQATRLIEAGCSDLQGYLFSRPLSLADLKEYIVANAPRESANAA